MGRGVREAAFYIAEAAAWLALGASAAWPQPGGPGDPAADVLAHTGAFADGTTSVHADGDVWHFTFDGDEHLDYQVDAGSAAIQTGLVRVFESSSQSYPIWVAGMAYRKSDGVVIQPTWLALDCTLTALYPLGDALVLEYHDEFGAGLDRRHTYSLAGKSLRITVESLSPSTDELDNYAGLYVGSTGSTENPDVLLMQGELAAPLIRFESGDEQWFLATHLDLFQSRASTWSMPQTEHAVHPSAITYAHSTWQSYLPDTAGRIGAPPADTLSLVVTQQIADALVLSSRGPSRHMPLLRRRPVLFLTGPTTTWPQYSQHLSQLHAWGLDELVAYTFDSWWTAQSLPAHWPAKDPAGLAAFGALARDLGVPFGLYSYFGPTNPGSPQHDPSDVAVDGGGSTKPEFTGLAMAEDAVLDHVVREVDLMAQDYLVGAVFCDVQTYASPSVGAGGDHVDQGSGSGHVRTLADAIRERKEWISQARGAVGGPFLGEGSQANVWGNMEYLWGGYCDSVQRTINSGASVEADEIPAGDPLAITSWPVIPEHEWHSAIVNQVNHGNGFYERFFGPSDGPEIFDLQSGLITPLPAVAHDRYRAYALTYGHSTLIQSNGPWDGEGNVQRFIDMAREYYLAGAVQERMFSSPVERIRYHHQGALRSFEEVLDMEGTTAAFVDPRVRIDFEDGFLLLVNHAPAPWTVSIGAKTYTLPEDGFVAADPADGFLAFSAAPSGYGARFDYALSPKRWEMLDGRGQVSEYGGVSTPYASFVAHHFGRGLVVRANASGVLSVVSEDPPALLSVRIEPPEVVLIPGAELGLRAIATFANGAERDVTTLLDWSAGDAGVCAVDAAGGVVAVAPGVTEVACVPYQGAVVPPVPVQVLAELALEIGPLVGGTATDFSVQGILPGETVHHLFGLGGEKPVGPGQVGLLPPAGLLVSDGAGPSGGAGFEAAVPTWLPEVEMWFQAVVVRPEASGGIVCSNVVKRLVHQP